MKSTFRKLPFLAVLSVGCSQQPPAVDTFVEGTSITIPLVAAAPSGPTWEECTARVRAGQFKDEWEEQDAWLETAQRLEAFLKSEPKHRAALRDLVVACVHLLSFEAEAPAAESLCLRAARRVTEFESLGAVLDADDRLLIDKSRQLLFSRMQIYPCVGDSRLGAVPPLLTSLGQDRFEVQETFDLVGMHVRVHRAMGSPPNPDLLWGTLYFVASKNVPAKPEETFAIVLARQGDGEHERWYLCFRGVSGSRIVSLLGQHPPADAELRSWVEKLIRASLETGRTS